MIRRFLLPVVAVAALAGCATDYGYRGGAGDYYYGRPQVEYRHPGAYAPYGGYYGGGYYGGGYYGNRGYVGGGYYGGRYYGSIGYGSPYGYGGYPYYGYPYYGYPHYRYPPVYYPRPPRNEGDGGSPSTPPDDSHDRDRDRESLPPWRRIGVLPPRDVRPVGVEDARRPALAQPPGGFAVPGGGRPVHASPRVGSPSLDAGPRRMAPEAMPRRPAVAAPQRSERRSSEEP